MYKKKILIVDDEENFAYIVKMNLEQASDYEVWIETKGSKALAGATATKPDLILLDIVMPDRDGFEVLKQLKSSKKTMSIPVIMLTAMGGDDAKMKAASQYSEGYIVKPITTEALKSKIEDVLKRRPA